jgi:hypothetical protein
VAGLTMWVDSVLQAFNAGDKQPQGGASDGGGDEEV